MSVKEVSISPRIRMIMDHHAEHLDRSEIPVRDDCYEEAFKEHPDEPACIRFAYGLDHFMQKKKILLNEYDLLAGFAYRYSYNTTMPIDFPRDYDPRFRPTRFLSAKKEAEMCADFYHWKPDNVGWDDFDFWERCLKGGVFKHWESGHIIPGYHRIIQKGFGKIRQECEEALKTAKGESRDFILSIKICAEACTRYVLRYRDLAWKRSLETSDPVYKNQMEKIAAACKHISTEPASDFFEAIQLLWLTHEIMYNESVPTSTSLGRIDQYLYPYYEKDVKEGKMTYEEASDLIDALWVKFSTTIHAYQNITLGGTDMNGKYQCNDLTFIALEATRRIRSDQPLISLRYSPDMPLALWEECVALLKLGLGFPAFFNDEGNIRARVRAGLTPEDACDYGIIGCVEPASPGAEYSKTEVLRINWAKILELMLHGKNTYGSSTVLTPFVNHTLDEFTDFASFYQWFKEELAAFSLRAMNIVNTMDRPWPYYYPTPALSMTMAGCIENGMDVTGGGTTYNNSGINTAGMANVVDSLAAIRQAVFEEHKLTLPELADILLHNFDGHDDLQHYLKNCCPKFGNDDNEADWIMKDLTDFYARVTESMRNPRGGRWQLGLYTVEDHSKLGTMTGALPEGRNAGISLANAIAPVQGADHTGPTAVLNSLVKTDLSVATNNMVLDLKFNPSFMAKPAHVAAMRAMINSFFRRGGLEIQFNIIDRATLIDAQAHPEKHRNLVVRVSGFSAYFVTLMKETQDEIIARTEYSAI